MRQKTEAWIGRAGCFGVIFIILFIVAMLTGVAHQLNRQTYEVVINKTERQCDGGTNGDCYYVVFGTNGEFFENRDAFLNWKWNSATLQAELKSGYLYKIKTTGFRVPFLSMKPNIIAVEEIGPVKPLSEVQ